MKIALVHRFFWPDTPPYALMLRYIANALASSGHDVTVISTQPSYKANYEIDQQPWTEELDGFLVKRIRVLNLKKAGMLSKLISSLSFCFLLLFRLIAEKPDMVMIATTPPILGGLIVRLACRITGAKYIYHCQDLYPEVANASGFIKKGLVYKGLAAIDRTTCDKAFKTIVLSEDMRLSLIERGCQGANILVINNFELKSFEQSSSKEQDSETTAIASAMLREQGVFRVLFAGNIGRFQGLETLIEAAHQVSYARNLEFVFLGEGAAMDELKGLASNLLGVNVKFFGHQTVEVARKLMADAQLCVVSLSEGIYRYAFPSKTMTYMCEGAPLLVMVEPESDLAKIVSAEKLGVVVSPGDSKKIAESIVSLQADPQTLGIMRASVKEYSERFFKLESVLPRWIELYEGDC